MAEVPEVEILVRDLREAVVGRTVLATDVHQPAAVRFPTVDEFTNLLTERVFLEAHGRAKYILQPLSGDILLTIHLGLWGTNCLSTDRWTEHLLLPQLSALILCDLTD